MAQYPNNTITKYGDKVSMYKRWAIRTSIISLYPTLCSTVENIAEMMPGVDYVGVINITQFGFRTGLIKKHEYDMIMFRVASQPAGESN